MANNDVNAAEQRSTMRVLIYSDNADVREQIRLSIGRRPAADVPKVELIECATAPGVLKRLDDRSVGVDVCVFDGEAAPAGGMGVCRQIKDEIFDSPPVLLVIGRRDDGWLATWSRADRVITHPIDPAALAESLAELMRERAATTPVLG